MKKIYCFGLVLLLTQTLLAFDKNMLQDSLTVYANERQHVGKITVTNVRVNGQIINIQAHQRLAAVSFTPDEVEELRHMVSRIVLGNEEGRVTIQTDGYELGELIVTRYKKGWQQPTPYRLEHAVKPLTKNRSRQWTAPDGLEGMHIALYGSHGQFYHQTNNRWMFQRARVLTTVEDLFTSSYTLPFLVPMLENAGAVVLQPRERDTQLHEVIVDDADARREGDWQTVEGTGWEGSKIPVLTETENPFRRGSYHKAETVDKHQEERRLYYEPKIAEAGDYAVYASYQSLPESVEKARYEVVHTGIKTELEVNQQIGGGTWIYLGTFHFDKDKKNNYVALTNYSRKAGVVTSDAVRFGGGMGSVGRKKWSDNEGDYNLSEIPRYMEGSRYWLQYAGFPDSIYLYSNGKNDYKEDLVSRGRWINYLCGGSETNPDAQFGGLKIPLHAALAFHSDAGIKTNDSIIGTLTIYTAFNNDKKKEYPTGQTRLLARDYADYVQAQIVEDMRRTLAPEWSRRGLNNASYAETRYPEIPTIILELLSHQNVADMRYGLDPRTRFIACRAVYKGLLKFLHEQYGTDYVVQPLPVEQFRIDFESDNVVRLSWQPRVDSLEETAVADYYIVYRREGNGDWDNGERVTQTQYTTALKQGVPTDFKVVAANDGGQSFPSEVLSAGISSHSKGKILLINGFTRVAAPESFRLDSTRAGFIPDSYAVPYGKDISYIGEQYEFDLAAPWVSDDDAGFGASYCDYATTEIVGNTFDYPAQDGRYLLDAGYSYASSSAAAIKTIPADYRAVYLILGKQRLTARGTERITTDYKTFPQNLQDALRGYTAKGGRLLVSGAYLASDMRAASDRKFLKDVLHCKYVTKKATRRGIVQTQKPMSIGKIEIEMLPNERVIFAEDPDGIAPVSNDAVLVARYGDSGIGAGVGYKKGSKTLVWSFPIESCKEADKVLIKSLQWLE